MLALARWRRVGAVSTVDCGRDCPRQWLRNAGRLCTSGTRAAHLVGMAPVSRPTFPTPSHSLPLPTPAPLKLGLVAPHQLILTSARFKHPSSTPSHHGRLLPALSHRLSHSLPGFWHGLRSLPLFLPATCPLAAAVCRPRIPPPPCRHDSAAVSPATLVSETPIHHLVAYLAIEATRASTTPAEETRLLFRPALATPTCFHDVADDQGVSATPRRLLVASPRDADHPS